MSISIHATRGLGHHPYVANAASDGSTLVRPWPGMSARAALIARSLTVALVSTWLAFAEPRLVVLLAFALPFWVAMELENAKTKRTASRVSRSSISRILRITF